MNYLITGGSGYLGKELIETFNNKENKIINLDIIPSNKKNCIDFNIDIENEIDVEKIFELNRIDVIIHNLASVPITKKNKNFLKINTGSTKLLLKLSNKYNVKKFIFISSSAVYGTPDKLPILETSKREPVELYGESKKKSEDLCFEEIDKGKNITIIRPRTIIGKNRLGIFSILFEWLKSDLPIPVLSKGNNLYQFIDIRDLCSAIELASHSDYKGSLNIGSDDVNKIIDVLKYLKKEFNSKSKIKNIDNSLIIKLGYLLQKMNLIPLQDYHFKAYGSDIYFESNLAKKVLKWEPKYSTFESFKDSFNFFLKDDKNSKNKSVHQKIIKNYILKYMTLFL
tara:strand:- start:91 stop:1110 length:1020 start_codon:yes stop_codon:yes gene_type:complete